MSTEKFHYFLTYATFINGKTGEMSNVTIKQGYGNNVINLSGLKFITSKVEEYIKTLDPTIDPVDIDIKSVAYLGEMTEAEYNS